uniref:Secreted protein n=1 Tax=Rhizophora mucronata TaxID=61149 RepID=A0A2P2JHM7_RHIMU
MLLLYMNCTCKWMCLLSFLFTCSVNFPCFKHIYCAYNFPCSFSLCRRVLREEPNGWSTKLKVKCKSHCQSCLRTTIWR